MYDRGDNVADWVKVQSWLFNKMLKKQERAFSKSRSFNITSIQSGYLTPQKDTPRINYQDALFDASRSMIRFKKPHRLIKMIDKIINDAVGVTHSAVLIYDNNRKSYVLTDSSGLEGRRIPAGLVRLDLKSPLIEMFRERSNNYFFEDSVISYKELNWVLESGQLLTKDAYLHNKLRSALREMELLDAEVCVPCLFKRNS